MKQIELLSEQLESKNAENSSNSLIKELDKAFNIEKINQQIKNTPLIARKINEKWFATTGNYRVTQEYDTYEELEENVTDTCITWEDAAKLIGAQFDFLQKEITKLQNQINEK